MKLYGNLVSDNSGKQSIGIGEQNGVDASSGHASAGIGDGGSVRDGEGLGQTEIPNGPFSAIIRSGDSVTGGEGEGLFVRALGLPGRLVRGAHGVWWCLHESDLALIFLCFYEALSIFITTHRLGFCGPSLFPHLHIKIIFISFLFFFPTTHIFLLFSAFYKPIIIDAKCCGRFYFNPDFHIIFYNFNLLILTIATS